MSTDAPQELIDVTLKSNTFDFPVETSDDLREISKTSAEITSIKTTDLQRPQNGNRRNNIRSRVNNNLQENLTVHRASASARVRTRTRAPKHIDSVANSVTPKNLERSFSRRRPAVSTDAPLVDFGTEVIQTEPRFKTYRKLEVPINSEKTTVDIASSRATRRKFVGQVSPSTPKAVEPQGRRSNFRSKTETIATFPSRNLFKPRDQPPNIDEQKLEVLPLFENEPKTVKPLDRSRPRERAPKKVESTTLSSRSLRSRGRTRTTIPAEETFLTSATETDVKFTKAPEPPSIVSVSVNVETRTESSFEKRPINKKSQTKESVVSEITEVTSKKIVTRRRNQLDNSVLPKDKSNNHRIKKIVAFRGRKKSEVDFNNIKRSKGDSSDEVDESDNYPEPFKALIHAKKTQVSDI